MPTEPYPEGRVPFSTYVSDLNDSLLASFIDEPIKQGEIVYVTRADCVRLGLDQKNPRGSMLQAMADSR